MGAEHEPLDELRERLRQTQEAAERIAGDIPAQGWATPREHRELADEIQALVSVLAALRDVLPGDVWEQVRDIVRRLLLLLRALVDVVVERLGGERASDARGSGARPGGPDLQDIPIT
jgi:hypothetical protein